MLERNVKRPAQTEWASAAAFAPRTFGTFRFCAEYRKLITVAIRDLYSFPRMDECIDSLGNAQAFSALDTNSDYLKIKVVPWSRQNADFTFHNRLYKSTRMSFGLKYAPAIFHRVVDTILSSGKWQFALYTLMI